MSGRNQLRDLRAKLLRVYSRDRYPWKARHKIKNFIRESRRIQLEYNERFLEIAGDIDFAHYVVRPERVLRTHQRH